MNKIIPFTKVITLNEEFDEIKKIALDNLLKLDDPYTIKGDLVIYGSYLKEEEEVEFKNNIPVEIAIDSKYDTSKCVIDIEDFYYEIINNQNLRIKIELNLDDLYYKEVKEEVNELVLEDNRNEVDSLEKDILKDLDLLQNDIVNEKNIEKKEVLENEHSFNEKMEKVLNDKEQPEYSLYRIYMVNDGDTLESILEKYKVTKDDLMPFNDLDNIKVGTKLIIPSLDE